MEIKSNRKDQSLCRGIVMATVVLLTIVGPLSGCSVNAALKAGMSDAEVTSGVQAALAADSRFDPYALTVETKDGRVRLGGIVGSMKERDSAERIAAASRGVDSVDNHIRFGPAVGGTGSGG